MTKKCLNLMLSKGLLLILFVVRSLTLVGQSTDQYIFPIRPGEQNYLAGTMAELRGSHFHGGLDIKTGGRIGLPVHATSDGYISRIGI
ncbi:MAG: murein DD-endopeptidase MepM/ murein hydrolase activator NlpD, partial [Cyclobacteriaceae bacterium]